MANVCDTEKCGCPVSGHNAECSVSGKGSSCGCPVSGCGCSVSGAQGTGCSDPFDNAPEVWGKDTLEAIRQVKLEILREKVRKNMGPQLEKAAEASLQALGTVWQVLLAQSNAAKAKDSFREEIRRIFSDGSKK